MQNISKPCIRLDSLMFYIIKHASFPKWYHTIKILIILIFFAIIKQRKNGGGYLWIFIMHGII